MAVSSDRRALRQERTLAGGAFVLIATVLLSGLAFLLTNDGCSGDGSFDVFGPNATRSSYCGTLHLPHVPNSIGGIGLVFLLFILPSLLVLIGTLVAILSERRLWLLWAALPAAALIVLSFLGIHLAHAGYLGVG